MAIKDIDGTYKKVLFDECMIKGNKIIVSFLTYMTEDDRNREKNQQEDFNKFVQNIWDKIRSYDAKLNELLLEYEATQNENVGLEYDSLIAERNKYINQWNSVENNYVLTENQESNLEKYITDEELKEFAFKEEWITNPIRINGIVSADTGDYMPLARTANSVINLDTEFYYKQLKTVMNENVQDI